jgi:hypothetical protein
VFTRTPKIINVLTAYERDLRAMNITTPERMLKNIQYIQNYLELLERTKFDVKAFVIMHHVLVAFFMMHSFIVPAVDPQAPSQAVIEAVEERHSPETSVRSEFSCYISEPSKKRVPNVWVGDSGASCHMTCSDEGIFNCRVIKSSVKIGNGKELSATRIGDKE